MRSTLSIRRELKRRQKTSRSGCKNTLHYLVDIDEVIFEKSSKVTNNLIVDLGIVVLNKCRGGRVTHKVDKVGTTLTKGT